MHKPREPQAQGHAHITAVDPVLTEHADAIRALGKQTIENIIEIGRRLTDAKRIAGHGNWLPWLDREFGWSRQTADRFIQVFEASGKLPNLSNLELPVSGLYMLAAPSTPPEARDAVIERAKAGEPVTVAGIKRVIEKAKGRRQPRRMPTRKPKPAAAPGSSKPKRPASADDVTLAEPPAPALPDAAVPVTSTADDIGTAGHETATGTPPQPPETVGKIAPAAAPKIAPAPDDIGPDSAGEVARLRARIDELIDDKNRLQIEIAGLRRGPADQDDPDGLGGLLRAWDKATDQGRQRFQSRVGLIADPLNIPEFLRREPVAS